MLTVHVADAPVPASVHDPLGVKSTVPTGVVVVPVSVSVTVTVQLKGVPTVPDAGQETVVLVVRRTTPMVVKSVLPE